LGSSPHYKASDFIRAIPGSGGIITTIAKRVGCSWETVKRHIQKYPTVKRAYEEERESIVDLAEVKLIKAIENDDMSAIKFYLTTIGKSRGFTEKQEIDQKSEVTFRVVYDK
jgi:hypothetical protein